MKTRNEELLKRVKNKRNLVILLLMIDAKVKVSQLIKLRIKDFDFGNKVISIGEKVYSISDRLIIAIAEYLKSDFEEHTPECYLFKGRGKEHISRGSINYYLKEVLQNYNEDLGKLTPEKLRKDEVLEIPTIAKVKRKFSLITKLFSVVNLLSVVNLFKRKKSIKPTSIISKPKYDAIIGRNEELKKIETLANKNVNTLILGDVGTGKTYLVENFEKTTTRKILKMYDTYEVKRTLIEILIFLYSNDKEKVFEMIYGNVDLDKIQAKFQRDSIKALSDEIKKIVNPNEYILIIDNIDRVTPKMIRTLEELKSHFTIITTARNVPVEKNTFLWNFEIIRIKNLDRKHSLSMINILSSDLETENKQLLRTHIYEQSAGNPRVIKEMLERYRKESFLDVETIREIKSNGNLKEWDLTFFVFIALAVVAVSRYFANEINDDRLKFIGGSAMLFLIISRYFFGFSKRKNV
ncbi:MAG: tyrosine-type recombinase/integrase [Raineya sp.]|jgi:hypothetical protein|nr:tyrosine-type recombinase/integrase [Raineya sp.]